MSTNTLNTKIISLILEAGVAMESRHLTIETWGNISMRDPETGLLYITPSGMPYNKLVPEDIVALNPDGSVYKGRRVPSVEAGLHAKIYTKRRDVNAILHTHPVSSTIFAVLHMSIPVVTDELAQAVGQEVRCADYALPGSPELADNCVKALGNGQAVLLANHGAVCAGKDLKECFKVAEVLETSAEIYYKALTIGKPCIIPKDKVEWMRDFAVNKYGKQNREE